VNLDIPHVAILTVKVVVPIDAVAIIIHGHKHYLNEISVRLLL
jgi:hypothetical protein